MYRSLTHLLLISGATLIVPAVPAVAACVPAGAPAGSTITCSGMIADLRNSADNLTVNVTADAHFQDTDRDAIRVRGNGNVVNIARGATLDSEAGDGIDGGAGLRVSNSGMIDVGNKGVDADGLADVTVLNYGTIRAHDKGIRVGDRAYVNNYATIASEIDEGIEAGDDTTVFNWADGVIEGSDDAIQLGENAYISNSGLIRSVARGGDADDPQDGIDIDSGQIFNNNPGRILSDDDAAIDFDASTTASSVSNRGLIEGRTGIIVEKGEGGEPANTASQTVTNFATGRIVGRSGVALDLGAGADEFVAYAGSVIQGASLFGEGDDRLRFNGNRFDQSFGRGSLFDGGTGEDTIVFGTLSSAGAVTTGYAFTDILGVTLASGIYGMTLGNTYGQLSFFFTDWEQFRFTDGNFALADLDGLATVIPLPAGALLLGSGLMAFGLLRRRLA